MRRKRRKSLLNETVNVPVYATSIWSTGWSNVSEFAIESANSSRRPLADPL